MTIGETIWYRWWRIRFNWRRFWTERLPLWVARHLPTWVVYWTVVHVATLKEMGNPAEVTAYEMMGKLDKRKYPSQPINQAN